MTLRPLLLSAVALGVVSAASAQRTTPPKAEPQMQAVLDQLAALGGKPIDSLPPAEARKQPTPADAVMALLKKRGKSTAPEAVGNVSDQKAGSVPVRVYTPSGNGPFPLLFYIHGGGWVIADLDTYDSSARALTNAVQAVVVSTHYRQGPEHKFPAAHEDTYASYKWAIANAKRLNADPQRVVVVGESAGGNMAANVSIRARDEKGTLPRAQVLVYPVASAAMNTPSYEENAVAAPLNKAMMAWFFEHYLNGPREKTDPRIALVDANLEGLPPTTVITAQIDPLRSEGQALAEKLKASGVDVAARNYEGVTHEFFGMGAVVDKAKEAVTFAAGRLKAALK